MGRRHGSGGFAPIQIGEYLRSYLKNNPGSKEADISKRLQTALKAYESGCLCHCGNPIWVIGSAETGNMCFTCITGEANPSNDYEIAEACDKYRFFTNHRVDGRGYLDPPELDSSRSSGINKDDVPF